MDGLVRFEVTGDDGFALAHPLRHRPRCPPSRRPGSAWTPQAYRDLRSGALDPQSAFMNQQIRVEGDMPAAMQLALAAVAPD